MGNPDPILLRRADEEISARSTPGALGLAVVTAALFFFTDAVDENPEVVGPLLVSAMVVNSARYLLARVFRPVYARSRRLWLGVFAGLGFSHALLWGVGSGFLIQYRGLTWSSLTIMLITAAMASGATTSLGPSLVQMRVYIGLILAPGTLFGFTAGEPASVTMGLMHGAYLLYLFAHGGRNHRVIWAHWRDERRLEEANEALARANADALEALRAKTMFLATMSHELRTPLNGVLGMAQLLERDRLSQPQREMVRTIRDSGEHLLALLNDILDLSRVEAGKLQLERVPTDVPALIADMVQLFRPLAARKHLDLRSSCAPALGGLLAVDPLRLRQVLANLIGNALKFTETGEVSVTALADEAADGALRVRVEVRDTGPGIAADKHEAIFENFAQADSSTTRRFGGSGLGLAICRKLVALMGGSIGVRSVEGQGATFWFELPASRVAAPEAPVAAGPVRASEEAAAEAPPRALRPARILLADDNPISQDVLRAMLRHLGCDVEIVGDGQAAVEEVERGLFDLVLLDCQMPRLDGYEAARRIRSLPGAKNRVPIVALTANALPGDEARCLEAGMDDYLAKPLQLGALERALARWIGPLEPGGGAAS